ncbi:MAG: hypothetical protein KA955_06600 [Prevotella sp.]|nr:hypothetical protein [Prevotella sp.]
MTHLKNISTYISKAITSILLLLLCTTVSAQYQYRKKTVVVEKDTIPFFRGIAISTDLVGPVMLSASDYGQYECALKVNLKDKYFPTVELGYGKANHNDGTNIDYKTQAPYFRIGCDFNILKNKHAPNRMFVGLRYAYTSYKYDVSKADFKDPAWGWNVNYNISNVSCSYHWIEAVIGVDSKIVGPLHLGWTVRYKHRIACNEGDYGNSWYVPGFGISSNTRLGGTFNVIIDI